MFNIHTLADVKAMYGEKVIETGTSFVVNAYGKYQPNISFVLAKEFSGDPLAYRSDTPTREMIAGLGFDFGTSESAVNVLFGDFWLSKAGKPHFRPKSPQVATHVLLRAGWGGGHGGSLTRGRWEAPEGVVYFRRAASNGGGTGNDYYVLPVGYCLVVRDEELDGDVVVTPDYSARAKAVRSSFATFDKAEADKSAAAAEAKAKAEVASHEAKADLLPRLLVAQTRLDALRSSNPNTSYSTLELGEVTFKFGRSEKLYTEANVAEAELCVEYWMARAEFQPQFEAFVPRVETLGLTLSFGEEKVNWEGGSYYGGFTYTKEGLESFKSDLIRKEKESAKKLREEAATAAKALAEAEAEMLGLPQNIRIWKRTGGATGCGMGWVITPDGFDRERDGLENDNPRRAARYDEGYLVWKQILPGELVLAWSKAYTAAPHEFEVVHLPSEGVTEAQLERVAEIQQELEDTWAGRRGLASGAPSPAVGRGWGLGDFVTPASTLDVYSTESVDMEEALQRLQDKFGKNR